MWIHCIIKCGNKSDVIWKNAPDVNYLHCTQSLLLHLCFIFYKVHFDFAGKY